MDAKSYPQNDYDETVLLETLRKKIKNELGDKIVDKIQHHFADKSAQNSVVCHGIADAVCQELSTSEAFANIKSSFLHNVKNILKESSRYENEVPRHSKFQDPKKLVSVNSSLSSSLNASSVVFLNAEQLNRVACLLLNGSPLHKLDALQTLCHLSSLEHLVTQSLWPSLENGLHKALSSSIHFIRDCSFRLFAKMLTSPIPQVVKESYHSLIKCLSNNLSLKAKKSSKYGVNASKHSVNFSMAVHIIALLNRFQQHISSHWLRYPQSIIEDIISGSVKLLTLSASDGNELVVWKHIALCDSSANWLKNFLHGNVSRELILSSFKKHPEVLMYAINFCEAFYACSSYKQFITNDSKRLCCSKSMYFYEVVHSLCFLVHVLEFSEGRQLLNSLLPGKSWFHIFEVVLLSTLKMSDVSCDSCFFQCSLTVSKSWVNILKLESPEKCSHLEELFEILINPISFHETRNTLSLGSICYIAQSISHIANSRVGSYCLFKMKDILFGFIALEYFLELSRSSFVTCKELAIKNNVACVSLHLIGSLVTSPLSSYLLTKQDIIHMFIQWWTDIFRSPYMADLKFTGKFYVASEKDALKKEILYVILSFLKTPVCATIYCKIGAFEPGFNILFYKTFKSLESGSTPCMCDVSTLAMFMSQALLVNCCLKEEDVTKVSWAVWHWAMKSKHHSRNGNLKKSLLILKTLVFAISDSLLYSDISQSIFQVNNLFDFVLFIPGTKKEDFVVEETERVVLALTVISLLVCNIKSLCMLQAKFEFQEYLLGCQSDFKLPDGNFIIDVVSVLQNHILVKSFAVGGPNERILPPETLTDVSETYNWPFFTSYPLPEAYYHAFCENVSHNKSSELLDTESLKQVFSSYLEKNNGCSRHDVVVLLKGSIKCMTMNEFLKGNLNEVDFCNVDGLPLDKAAEIGISMAVRYGTKLKAVSGNCEFEMNYILKSCKALFGDNYCKSFDLFPATVYLMLEGDFQTTWTFLEKFAGYKNSLFVWMDRFDLISKLELSDACFSEGILFQFCDLIVHESLPTVFAAFQLCGSLPSVIFMHWIGHCFWNYLNWDEICHFILMTVLFSGDYSVYFFVAVLKHLKSKILKLSHNKDLLIHLKQDPIENFEAAGYKEYMDGLATTYHKKFELLFDIKDSSHTT